MSPKMKSKINKSRSRKNYVPKDEKISFKSSSPMKTRSKLRIVSKTPNNKNIEPIPCSSSTADSSYISIEKIQKSEKEDVSITPKVMKYYLNAYKQSPDYNDLRKKRFNTSFRFGNPRGYRDIQIFTPEEEHSPKWSENLPLIENKIQGEPGQKYANVFMSIPGLSISDSDEDIKPGEVDETKGKCAGKKGKKGRKKSIGYKGVPLSDECLLIDYTSLLYSPSSKLDKNETNRHVSSDM